jgi:hypothetical protein
MSGNILSSGKQIYSSSNIIKWAVDENSCKITLVTIYKIVILFFKCKIMYDKHDWISNVWKKEHVLVLLYD